MRTSTTNDDVYLSILASRAVTALAKLAENPDQRPDEWPVAIKSDLEKGLAFCESVSGQDATAAQDAEEPLGPILRRLTAEMSTMRSGIRVADDEIRSKKEFFKQLVALERRPSLQEITDAINFFLAATSGYVVKKKSAEELF